MKYIELKQQYMNKTAGSPIYKETAKYTDLAKKTLATMIGNDIGSKTYVDAKGLNDTASRALAALKNSPNKVNAHSWWASVMGPDLHPGMLATYQNLSDGVAAGRILGGAEKIVGGAGNIDFARKNSALIQKLLRRYPAAGVDSAPTLSAMLNPKTTTKPLASKASALLAKVLGAIKHK